MVFHWRSDYSQHSGNRRDPCYCRVLEWYPGQYGSSNDIEVETYARNGTGETRESISVFLCAGRLQPVWERFRNWIPNETRWIRNLEVYHSRSISNEHYFGCIQWQLVYVWWSGSRWSIGSTPSSRTRQKLPTHSRASSIVYFLGINGGWPHNALEHLSKWIMAVF